MDLKGIMLSEISWAGKNKYSMISHMKSKKKIITIKEVRFVVIRGGGEEEMVDCGQKTQPYAYK